MGSFWRRWSEGLLLVDVGAASRLYLELLSMAVNRRRGTRGIPQAISLASGVLYAFAVIVSIALGAIFFKGYQQTQEENQLRLSAREEMKFKPIRLASDDLPPDSRPAGAVRVDAHPANINLRCQQSDVQPLPSPLKRVPWSADGSAFHRPQTVTVVPLADTTILTEPPGERNRNSGKSTRLLLEGNKAFALVKFDLGSMRGWTIKSAVWHAKLDSGSAHEFGFSTIMNDWKEGDGRGRGKPGDGANYYLTGRGSDFWSKNEGPVTYVMRGNGQSLFSVNYVPAEQNRSREWISLSVHPVLVQALIAGAAKGIAITDETGQSSVSPISIYSRETSASHYLEVKGELIDVVPPGKVSKLTCSSHPNLACKNSTGVLLSWIASGDDNDRGQAFRYDIRHSSSGQPFERATQLSLTEVPFPPLPAGERDHVIIRNLKPDTQYTFYIRAVDEVGKYGPVASLNFKTGKALKLPPVVQPVVHKGGPIATDGDLLSVNVFDEYVGINPVSGTVYSRIGGAGANPPGRESYIWDSSSRSIHLAGARNETVACILQIGSTRSDFPSVRLTAEDFTSPDGKFPGSIAKFYRVACQRGSSSDWLGDALVPIVGYFDIPWEKSGGVKQSFQPVYFEIDIPDNAHPGLYKSAVVVEAGGQKTALEVQLNVLSPVLPETESFAIELLAESTMVRLYGENPSDTVSSFPIERAYHRLAREHHCSFVQIPCSRDGECAEPFGPRLSRKSGDVQVASWVAWDERFSELMDGSAFVSDGERKRPIPYCILPLSANWPMLLHDGYLGRKWNGRGIRSGTLVFVGPSTQLQDCFSGDYWSSFSDVTRNFAAHFTKNDWDSTVAHIWLNGVPSHVAGELSLPWSLGNPRFRDDFLALQAYARRIAVDSASVWRPGASRFRVNIASAVNLQKYGRGFFDLLCVSDQDAHGWSALRSRVADSGETLWFQIDELPSGNSCLSAAALAVTSFLEGADGFSIRKTTGSVDDWRRLTPESVLYCGAYLDQTKPFSSLRLKALRRAEQDIEWLRMLQSETGWSREQLAEFARRYITDELGSLSSDCGDWYHLRTAVQAMF